MHRATVDIVRQTPFAVRGWFALATSVILVACGGTTETSLLRRPAWLGPMGHPQRVIVAPDTVRAGVPFLVTVFAAGSIEVSCNTPDGVKLGQSSSLARLEVFVKIPATFPPCIDVLDFYPITATLTFNTPGIGTIRAIGANSSERPTSPDSLQRQVIVVP